MVGKSTIKLYSFRNEFRLSISDYMALSYFFSNAQQKFFLKYYKTIHVHAWSMYILFFLLNKQSLLIKAYFKGVEFLKTPPPPPPQ